MQNEAEISILISENIDFKSKTVTRDGKSYYRMIKGSFAKRM